MKAVKIGALVVFGILLGGIIAWIVRGEYDKIFLLDGHFHVVSSAKNDHKITLKFPSGERVRFGLNNGSSYDFKVPNTGEGAIGVLIDGKLREYVGYVTSSNSIVILVIGNEKTVFSQIFPSLSTEQDAAPDAGQQRR